MRTFTATWEGTAVSKNENQKRGKVSGAVGRARYQCFIDGVAWTLRAAALAQGSPVFTGPVSVRLEICCPSRMDHHNLVDPLMDALQRSGVLENDRKAWHVEAVRVGNAVPGVRSRARVVFMVKEVEPIDKGDY